MVGFTGEEVYVGAWVKVAVGVTGVYVGMRVKVPEGVKEGALVFESVGVLVGRDAVDVAEEPGVWVGLGPGVKVAVVVGRGVRVKVAVAVGRGVRVKVAVGRGVTVKVGVGEGGGVGASPSTVKVPTTFH